MTSPLALLTFFIFAASSFINLPVHASSKSSTESESIQEIRSKYEKIKELEPKMKKQTLDQASGESAEGSTAEVFRANGEIKEIREEYFGESGKAKYSYFYDSGKPFFVLLADTTYSLPLMQPVEGMPKPTQSTLEHRFYFKDGKLIKWLKGKKDIKPSNKEFARRETEILSSSKAAFSAIPQGK